MFPPPNIPPIPSETSQRSPKDANKTLPQEWTQHTSKDGRMFWHNTAANKSTWEKPDCLKSELETVMATQTEWKEYTSGDGRPYWYHTETKKSVWECPEEVAKLKEELAIEWVPYTDKAEARNRLKTLFKLKNLGARTRWEDALTSIKNDSRFSCFVCLTNGEKKQAFAEFQNQMQKKLRDKERIRKVEARRAFTESLAAWPPLTPASLLSEFENAYQNEWWIACLPTSEKDELLNDFMEEFEPGYWEKQRDLRKHHRECILEFLCSSPKITIDLTWREAAEVLLGEEVVRGGEPKDFLNCWEEFVYEKDNQERELLKRKVNRARRKRRDTFRNLIRQKIENGEINARVSFPEFLRGYEEDETYLNVVGVPVTTPREIFEQETSKLVEDYENQKQILKNILKVSETRVTSSTTFEKFLELVEKSEDCHLISEKNRELFYDSLKRRAIRREKERRDLENEEREASPMKRNRSPRSRSPREYKKRCRDNSQGRRSESHHRRSYSQELVAAAKSPSLDDVNMSQSDEKNNSVRDNDDD